MKNHHFFRENAFVAFLISTAVLFSVSCSKQPIELSPGNNTSSSGKVSSTFSENYNYIPDVNNNFQAKAVSYYDKIENAFSSTPGRIRNETSDYPGYYGGAYINPQGKLVVLIKGDVSKEKKNIAKIIGSDDFITLPCKHSYKTLVKIMKDLNEFCLNKANDSKSMNTNAYGFRADLNQITVELADFSDKKISEFKNDVMNSDAIVFKKSAGRMTELAGLEPGCPAYTDNYAGSFAFRAQRNSDGQVGMVSAGHLLAVGAPLYENGVVIGNCSISRNSGSVDAAFVPINDPDTYYPSNTICNTGTLLSTTTSRPGLGTIVNMRGKTTGYSSGKILDTDASIRNEAGLIMTNLTSADFPVAGGDSGGIVYTVISSTNARPTVGIVKGIVESTGIAYFCKADLVLTALGVSRF